MRSIVATTAVLCLLTSATAAPAAEDLPTFLKAASAMRPNAPVRADGTLATTSPDGTAKDQIAIVQRPNGDLYVELKTSGVRALLSADGKTALIVPGAGESSDSFALDAPLGASEFTREDLRPFRLDDYRSPTIVDRREGEVTVSLTPNPPSQYALQVVTFDTAAKVPLLVKDYKETISNLVKMRRSRSLGTVAGMALPGEIVMENFPLRATSTMTLTWKQTADLPALFDPAAMEKPSTLTW